MLQKPGARAFRRTRKKEILFFLQALWYIEKYHLLKTLNGLHIMKMVRFDCKLSGIVLWMRVLLRCSLTLS
jgi:hypothetical protein